MRYFTQVAKDVQKEIDRQDIKWGADRVSHLFEWLAILVEEVGEFSEAALHTEFGGKEAGNAYKELSHVSAVAMQIMNSLLLKDSGWKENASLLIADWEPRIKAMKDKELTNVMAEFEASYVVMKKALVEEFGIRKSLLEKREVGNGCREGT